MSVRRKSWRCKVLILQLFLLIQVCGLCAYAAEKEPRNVIRVGFFAFDGYHMMDENGERSGYGYDFLRLASRYLDVDFEYIGYDKSWDEIQDMLENGEIDILTSAQATSARQDDFDFSKAIGTSSAMLTVKNTNQTIQASDYSTYEGMRVALLKGNSRNDDLNSYADEKGFSYTPVYFDMADDLEKALQSGQVDAALTSSLRRTHGEQILDLFAAREFYVMVRKGDTELLDQLNYAIEQMEAVEGDWQNELSNKYYSHENEKNLTFTDEELELIRQYADGEKKLVMTASMDRDPYSYVENGELKGIIPDYFAQLAEYAGIPYELAVPTSREEYEQWRFDGTVDGFIDARIDSQQWIEENSFSTSVSYTEMKLAMVTRRDFDGNIQKLAVATAQGLFGIENNLARDAERIIVDSREAAMQAVLDGKADAAFVYLYTAQQFVNQDERGLLTYTMLEQPTYDYCVAFTDQISHELSGIFTKCIYAMPSGSFENLAAQYTSYRAKDIDLSTWIRIYPMAAIALCVVLFMLGLFAILLFQRHKVFRLEQKRAKELQLLTVQAEQANQAKSDFLTNVSHDIRTPMNAIVGIANLMAQEQEVSGQLRDYIRKIQNSSTHLLSLIDDVLDMSKIEAEKLTLNPEPVSLEEQIRLVEDIIRELASQREQIFSVQLHELQHDSVVTDSARLRQILLNLLSNAVKYTQKGGRICFLLEELPCDKEEMARFCFCVSDNGCGMKPEFLKHIFEPFVRNEASVTNRVQGTGLGMTITKGIVDLMGGEITAESTPGAGSCFRVVLTMPIAQEEVEWFGQPAKEQSILHGLRFLCAEDNGLNAEILSATLEGYGAVCTIYEDGVQLTDAFEKVQPGEYDAVLMDIQMPNMNGLEAARAIRSSANPLGRTIPIIAMSANAFTEDVQRSIEAGMNAHISKPINMKLLEKEMRVALCSDKATGEKK